MKLYQTAGPAAVLYRVDALGTVTPKACDISDNPLQNVKMLK